MKRTEWLGFFRGMNMLDLARHSELRPSNTDPPGWSCFMDTVNDMTLESHHSGKQRLPQTLQHLRTVGATFSTKPFQFVELPTLAKYRRYRQHCLAFLLRARPSAE